VYEDNARAANGEYAERALMTPWPTVNKNVGGFHPGELVVAPSAPGQGKTGMVLTLVDWFSLKFGLVALFSIEMNKLSLSRRLLAMHSGVSARSQRLGDISGAEWDRLGDAAVGNA
jgi:replicative DNA helicase